MDIPSPRGESQKAEQNQMSPKDVTIDYKDIHIEGWPAIIIAAIPAALIFFAGMLIGVLL